MRFCKFCIAGLIIVQAAAAASPSRGPKTLFHDPEIHPTLDEIKGRTLADLRWDESKEVVSKDPRTGATVVTGRFSSGTFSHFRLRNLVDYIGVPKMQFRDDKRQVLKPVPGKKGDLKALLAGRMTVSMWHPAMLVLPKNFDPEAEASKYVFVLVSQHVNDPMTQWESIDFDMNESRRRLLDFTERYGVAGLWVGDLITLTHMRDKKGQTLGFPGGNELISWSTPLMAALSADPDYDFATKDMVLGGNYPYIVAYTSTLTLAERLIERRYPGTSAGSKFIITGGSKVGAAALFTADVDDRVAALYAGGYDLFDVSSPTSTVARYETDWKICGQGTPTGFNNHIPYASIPAVARWLARHPDGIRMREIWEPMQFARDARPDLFLLYKWSTHDLHYPIGSTVRFWNEAGYRNPHRHNVSVNWNHGGEYRPGPGEPLCDRLDMLLGHVVDGREMVDAELTKAEVVESRGRKLLRVEVLAKSRYQIGGATALIAKSTDRDFSLATGLEGLGEYGPTRGKNELGAYWPPSLKTLKLLKTRMDRTAKTGRKA